jgi:preprotein translocase subunit SecB
MNIKFLGTKVEKLSLIAGDNEEPISEDDFQLSFINGFSDEDDKSFIVKFSVKISSIEENFTLKLQYVGFFATEGTITEEFRKSNFPNVNAPAIAYPFMRSFINTITVNSNLNPVIIPTINFQKLVRQQEV